MDTVDRIKELAESKSMSIAELERKLQLSNGSISRWKKASPNSKSLAAIADYFSVSVDYLLGREKRNPDIFFRSIIEDNNLSESEVMEIKEEMEDFFKFRAERMRNRKQ